jgi:hypothetical protein
MPRFKDANDSVSYLLEVAQLAATFLQPCAAGDYA